MFFHPYLDFPRDLHTSDFPTKFLYAFLIAPTVATTPTQLILDLKTPYLQSTNFGTQVMLPVFYSVKCGDGYSILPYPPDSDTVQHHQDHRSSSQPLAFNTVAVQNGGFCVRTYWAESRDWISYCGRLQSDRDSQTSEKRVWCGCHTC